MVISLDFASTVTDPWNLSIHQLVQIDEGTGIMPVTNFILRKDSMIQLIKGNTRSLAILAGVLALAAGVALGVGGGLFGSVSEAQAASAEEDEAEKKKEPANVAVEPVAEGTISSFIAATANLVAEDDVQIVAETEGKATHLYVEEGDYVQKGQKLLQVDPADRQLEVQKAELALRNARIYLERGEKMTADQLISTEELDRLRYDRDVARHDLGDAQHKLGKTIVRSPFAGTITIREVRQGQNVKVGDPLFSVADFDPLVARIFLPEREVIDLREGQAAELHLKARPDVRFKGHIRQISPIVDTASGTVKVTVEAADPPASVRPGAFVSVGIVRQTRAAALLIPRTAVIRELQETFVFVAEGDSAKRRIVELGLQEGDRCEVIAGLVAGEQVVVSGQGALKNDAPIKILEAQAP